MDKVTEACVAVIGSSSAMARRMAAQVVQLGCDRDQGIITPADYVDAARAALDLTQFERDRLLISVLKERDAAASLILAALEALVAA